MTEVEQQLREDNRKLAESQTFMRRVVAMLTEGAGGEIILDKFTMLKANPDPTIVTWTDEQGRLHIKTP